MEKEEIKALANNLLMDLSDEEAEDIRLEFIKLDEMLAFFEQIDTEGIEDMVYPYDVETEFFSEDEVSNCLSQEDAVANAARVISGHVVVPKVVR